MIVYSVTITIAAAVEADWLDWMGRVHVPDVLKTGCFLRCRMYKSLTPRPSSAQAVRPGSPQAVPGDEPTYVLQYDCRSVEEYERYRDHFAPALQKEHSERFAGRFKGSRIVLEELQQLGSVAAPPED